MTSPAASPGDLSDEIQRRFLQSCATGEAVFEPGDRGGTLFVIQSGEVEIHRSGSDGARVVDRLGPGEFFGEMSVVLGGARSVRAVATQPSRLLCIDRHTFENMCMERPEIAMRIIERLAARVLQFERRLGELGTLELGRSVARQLLQACGERDGAARVETSLKRLADHTGLSMLDTHRVLQELMERKLLRLESDGVRIPDVAALLEYTRSATPAPSLD